VSTDIIVGFKKDDLVILAQQISGGHTGNPGTDNGYLHLMASLQFVFAEFLNYRRTMF
jgi:hypothetical protein